jgi:glutamate-1-semialdehyde 2,1-aminomutase
MLNRAKKLIPWASQTRSKSYKRFPDNSSHFINKGLGCKVWGEDGKSYLDFLSAQGAIILGYRNQAVDNAVMSQILDSGSLFSLPHKLEGEVAEMLSYLIPCAEMVLFLKNGGDSTAAAVRLARQVTGKTKVLNHGYHGWFIFDQIEHFDSPSDLSEKILHAAAVIIEPELFTKQELRHIQILCKSEGALLIFDEVLSGFRIAIGGMQEFYGIVPDLACFSKAMSNGYPISALVGKREYMQRLDQDVFVSTTFGGDCIGLAATKVTINEILRLNIVDHLWELGTYLEIELRKLIQKYDFPMKLHGFPPLLHFKIPEEIHGIFLQEMIKRGILIYHNHTLNYSHKKHDIDCLLTVYNDVFPLLKEGKIKLEGNPIGSSQVFRQWRD